MLTSEIGRKTETLSLRGMDLNEILGLAQHAITLNAEEFVLYVDEDNNAMLRCSRFVTSGEPVLPPRAVDIAADPAAVIEKLELETLEPQPHPFHALHNAQALLRSMTPHPARWLIAENKEVAAAFFGFETAQDRLFGLEVLETGEVYADRLVVVSSPTTLLLHANAGVVIDLGI